MELCEAFLTFIVIIVIVGLVSIAIGNGEISEEEYAQVEKWCKENVRVQEKANTFLEQSGKINKHQYGILEDIYNYQGSYDIQQRIKSLPETQPAID